MDGGKWLDVTRPGPSTVFEESFLATWPPFGRPTPHSPERDTYPLQHSASHNSINGPARLITVTRLFRVTHTFLSPRMSRPRHPGSFFTIILVTPWTAGDSQGVFSCHPYTFD